jgi:hypothetical protein
MTREKCYKCYGPFDLTCQKCRGHDGKCGPISPKGAPDPVENKEPGATCSKCGYDGEHSSEQCARIRIAKAKLEEAEWWRGGDCHYGTCRNKKCVYCARYAEAEREFERAQEDESR